MSGEADADEEETEAELPDLQPGTDDLNSCVMKLLDGLNQPLGGRGRRVFSRSMGTRDFQMGALGRFHRTSLAQSQRLPRGSEIDPGLQGELDAFKAELAKRLDGARGTKRQLAARLHRMCSITPGFMELMGRVRQTCIGIRSAIDEVKGRTQDGEEAAANALVARLRKRVADGQTRMAAFHTCLDKRLDSEE
jgi:hypothetical protein